MEERAGDELRIDRSAEVRRIELPEASWVEHVTGFVRDAVAAVDEMHTSLRWEQTEVLRYDRYVPEQRLGAGMRADSHPVTRQTELHLRSRLLYRNGTRR